MCIRDRYKLKAKASVAQRESEGIIVVSMAAQKNAVGAKGPCGKGVGEAGKREGMAAKSGPNNPGRRTTGDKVQRLQRRLWIAAKRSSGRRFHAFHNHLWRSDVLSEAWKRVKANRGAAGVDSVTLVAIEQNGVGSFLEAIASSLRAGTYRPSVVLRRYIPKAGRGARLGSRRSETG